MGTASPSAEPVPAEPVRLVTVAHGTRHGTGNEVARSLAHGVGARLGIPAVSSYVELCEPFFAEVLADMAEPTEVVAVPLLLSRGYHVAVDLPAAVIGAAGTVTLAPPLGPDPLLARAQAARLIEAGAVPGETAVLIAAGSRDPRAWSDLTRAAALLSEIWGSRVRVAVMSGEGPRPDQVIVPGDAVSLYLLSPGHFATMATEAARSGGAGAVAGVIGAHPAILELVAARVRAALAGGASPLSGSAAPV